MSAPKFLATGRCLPAKIVTNDDLSRTAVSYTHLTLPTTRSV